MMIAPIKHHPPRKIVPAGSESARGGAEENKRSRWKALTRSYANSPRRAIAAYTISADLMVIAFAAADRVLS